MPLYVSPHTKRLYSSWHVAEQCNATSLLIGDETLRCSSYLAVECPRLERVETPCAGQLVTIAWRGPEDTVNSYWEARIVSVDAEQRLATVRWRFNWDDAVVSFSSIRCRPIATLPEDAWPRSISMNPEW